MRINYNLTEKDYLNFNLFHVENSKATRKVLNTQRFVSPIIFIAMAFVFSRVGNVSLLVTLITFSLISIFWIIFYPKYFYRHITRHTKKMLKEGKNDGLFGEGYLILSDEGIVDSTSNGETKVEWAGINKIEEDADYFFIYSSSVAAYILPKRAVTSVEETRNYMTSKLRNPI